ncbi:hypothetical protein ABC255_08865 [Neobacillus sp. 3P2-tot-E-2]
MNRINKQQERPPCTVTSLNEPNFELMAKAIANLYESLKQKKI